MQLAGLKVSVRHTENKWKHRLSSHHQQLFMIIHVPITVSREWSVWIWQVATVNKRPRRRAAPCFTGGPENHSNITQSTNHQASPERLHVSAAVHWKQHVDTVDLKSIMWNYLFWLTIVSQLWNNPLMYHSLVKQKNVWFDVYCFVLFKGHIRQEWDWSLSY